MSTRWSVVLGLVLGCSSTPSAEVAFSTDCAPIDRWSVPPTVIGQTSSAQLRAVATKAGNLELGITGDAAADYAIDLEGSTCDNFGELAPNEPCIVAIELTPSAEGPRDAVLAVGETKLALHGEGIVAPAGLVASVRNASSVHGLLTSQSRTAADQVDADHSRYTISIRNAGAQTITPGPADIAGTGLAVEATNSCGFPLAPGNACEVTIVTSQFAPGCASGTYRLASSANTVEIPITNTFVGGVTVTADGPGKGRIVSSPPGIDCPGNCTGVFTEPVTLTALPASGQHFNGWSDRTCGETASCTLAPAYLDEHGRTATRALTASFATKGARRLDVTFAGDGTGVVAFSGESGLLRAPLAPPCTESCTRWIERTNPVTVVSGTASRFDGWGDRCLGRTCDLGVLAGDTAVTAAFSKAPDEEVTLYPRVPTELGAFTSDGDLVVTGVETLPSPAIRGKVLVSRLSATGERRWVHRLDEASTACNLKVKSANEIYVIAMRDAQHAFLFALDGAGQVRWSQPLGPARSCSLSVAGNGDVITNGFATDQTEALVRWSSAGTQRWIVTDTGPGLPSRERAVVLDAAGTVGQLEYAGASLVLARYDAAGVPLAAWSLGDLAPPPSAVLADLIASPGGAVTVQTVTGRNRRMQRLDASGAIAFDRTDELQTVSLGFSVPQAQLGMSVRPDGQLFAWSGIGIMASFGVYFAGAHLERFDGTGGRVWAFEEIAAQPALPRSTGGPPLDAPVVKSSACDGTGRCAVFGTYEGVGGGPWIEIFKP